MKRLLPFLFLAGAALGAPLDILNVSYDVTREFYQSYNRAFSAAYEKENGKAPTVDLSNGGSSKQARAVIEGLEADVVTMNQETGIDAIVKAGLIANAATNAFVQKEIGDALLTFESEVPQITKVFSPDQFDVVYPSTSILAEAPVGVVDKVVERRGTRKLATDYLEYLWSEEGQRIPVQSSFRPRSERLLAESAALFPPLRLVSVDEAFGGWAEGQRDHFADGGYFDQIYQAK
jgi:ABC-type sulfate transport system substrate-binding protein